MRQWVGFDKFKNEEITVLQRTEPFWDANKGVTHKQTKGDYTSRKSKNVHIEWLPDEGGQEVYNISVYGYTPYAFGKVIPAYSFIFKSKIQQPSQQELLRKNDGKPYFTEVGFTSVMHDYTATEYVDYYTPGYLQDYMGEAKQDIIAEEDLSSMYT